MNKIFKNLIMVVIVVCTISTISFAANSTNPDGKGTVNGGTGTKDDPYKLVMGEGVIDIYYENAGEIYFEFIDGNVNAGNYMVDHNADLKRLRFTLIGTTDSSRRVTSQDGLKYLQAGGVTIYTESQENNDKDYDTLVEKNLDDTLNINSGVQNPFYKIKATETFYADKESVTYTKTPAGTEWKAGKTSTEIVEMKKSFSLGNGYLNVVNNTLLGNASNYSTSYIFSKSKVKFEDAYELSAQQLSKGKDLKINFDEFGKLNVKDNIPTFESVRMEYGKRDQSDKRMVDTYKGYGTVRVVYMYGGTTSETLVAKANENSIEALISKVFTSIGDMFVKVCNLGGAGVDTIISIDSLVFNEYQNTIVDFWGDIGFTNGKAKNVISFWYKVFQSWSIIIYIILLIYIGIKTVLVSGTAEQKNVKTMLEGWLQGLLILFILPFWFKYVIEINDLIVDIIRTNSKYSIYSYYSFEEYYENLQEDGEYSTATVLEKLEDAKEFLEDEIAIIEAEKEIEQERLEKAAEVLNGLENESESGIFAIKAINAGIDRSKTIINKYLTDNNLKLSKDGRIINIEVLESELSELVNDFYSKEENKQKFINSENILQAVLDNEEFNEEINKYIRKYKIISSVNNNEITDNNIENTLSSYIDALAKNILPRESYDIFYASMENDLLDVEQNMQNTEMKIANLNKAIEMAENNNADIMGKMRIKIDETYSFLYVAVWFIMVFEVVILLVLYYKRLFMLMALIAIFPLITVAYAYEKSKGGRASILSSWLKEYVANVFIQSIHALLYVILVETGYSIYIVDNDNWLIFVFAVLCMIMIEPVFKNLLGIRGSTVTDLANYSASALKTIAVGTAVAGTVASTHKDLAKINTESKNKEVKINAKNEEKDRKRQIRRLERDNRINTQGNITESQRQSRLNKMHKKDERKDKSLERRRKIAAKGRKVATDARMVGRVTANVTSMYGAVAGGIAAGGQMDDFIKSSAIAKTITGTGGKASLSPEAQKAEEEKAAVNNKVKSVNTETPLDRTPRYNGQSYEDYRRAGNGNSNNGGNNNGNSGNANKGGNNSKFAKVVRNKLGSKNNINDNAERLEQQKVFVNTNFNIREEDENN